MRASKNFMRDRKGVFYLMISSLFLIVMVFIFVAYKEYKFTDRQKVVETRISTINDFIKDVDFDSKRVIYISGFRSLIALEDYVAKSGIYLSDMQGIFRDAFYNGTINGTGVEVLKNSTYQDYLAKLKVIADSIGISVDINVTGVELYHDSPWTVNIIVKTHVNVTDTKGVANWDFNKDYQTSVSLVNIRDPLYSVSTYGRVPNTIRRTNVTDFVVDSTNNTYGLQLHNNNSYYIENTLAPSFLMRLQGNFSPSVHGIESLVYTPEFDIQGVAYDTSNSVVDYILLGNMTGYPACAYSVQNMPSWFRIDLNHTAKYEVNQLTYSNMTC